MNASLLLVGIILLVFGVMGFMYASDQASVHRVNALFSGHSSDYGVWKLGTYALAGLSVLGGVLCAAGIFSTPAPVCERAKSDPDESKEPKIIDDATRDEIKSRYFRYGVILAVGGVAALLVPGSIFVIPGVLVAITGFFFIVVTLLV